MSREADETSRRSFLKTAGGATVATASITSLAGCGGGGDDTEADDGGGDDTQTEADSGGGGGDTQTLRYGRGAHSSTLDPQNTTSGEVAKVTNQAYEGLIAFEPGEAALTESLATDWSVDGQSVSVTLREDVTFHDGTDFTADDFIATYRRFVDEEYEYYFEDASVYGPFTLGSWIDSIDAPGDYELSITLTQEYAPFLRNLAMFTAVVVSQDAIEGDTDLDEAMVGTGPFELETLDNSNNRIQLTAFDDYWGDAPNIDEVLFLTRGQNSTRAQALVEEELDIIDGLDPDSMQIVDGSDTAETRTATGINIGYMAFNLSRVEAFRDRRVRRAVSLAINTQTIVENIYSGIATQADQPIPPALFGHNEDISPYEHDPEQAQSLLEEAGYGDGFSFTLTTFQNPRGYNPAPLPTAETIRSNLQQVGIEVEIDDRQFSDYLTYTSEGRHDATLAGWFTDNADPDNFCYALMHPQVESPEGQDWIDWGTEGFNTGNNAAWANAEFMDLVDQAQQVSDEGERAELYQEASQIAHDEAPWVYIDYADEVRGVSTGVSNYVVAAIGGPYLKQVEVE
ncbi:ABC transporter substrate-binding protein [Halobellus salinus]|uniref:ABC transporter substrate-binding protein n=1 Tax=Halobellus salinus TaxID=931585 RepID=A0A830EIJ5_9EURY|nr:ABC transporter substrate-binding protein [Halobellus salinus]GGJ13656.1 ABC transporter substrate-binding protein [Halobellus salinus]SMP30990.1 peptide/nickel transport system substrate-binding protein [Halobellus salinus]